MTSTRHARLMEELCSLLPKLLFGTASSTYRTCGTVSCVCHEGERHGPYMHVSYRADGRTCGFYVPAQLQAQVTEGLEAWGRFQAIAREVAESNREALGLGKKSASQRTGVVYK